MNDREILVNGCLYTAVVGASKALGRTLNRDAQHELIALIEEEGAFPWAGLEKLPRLLASIGPLEVVYGERSSTIEVSEDDPVIAGYLTGNMFGDQKMAHAEFFFISSDTVEWLRDVDVVLMIVFK